MDHERLVATAEAAADAAGRIIRPHFRNAGLGLQTKADLSPVTVADRDAEQAIRAVIGEREPGHRILGEEAGEGGGGIAPDGLRWVVDPIDGTRAFITGRPTFGTLIALLDGDRPVLGLIDQPITGERWIGVAGQPTRFRGPLGGRAGIRPCPDLASAELAATTPAMFEGGTRAGFDRLQAATARTSWGGDCYLYGLLALGQIDIVAEASMQVWDWAALVPIVEGAGGAITDWRGRPLREGRGDVLAVGDAGLLGAASALLTGL